MTADFALLILRVVVGLLFMGHGAQKLFGWFDGPGLDGFAQLLDKLGVEPSKFWAAVTGLAELAGGALLLLGLFTPLGALAVMGVMIIAIGQVHWDNGFWNGNRGIEFPLVLATVAFVIGFMGVGAYSLDAMLGTALPMPEAFAWGLLVVIAGDVVAILSGRFIGEPTGQHEPQT